MFVSIITIGDELLLGQTLDTNSYWLGQQLSDLGARVVLKMAVKDEENEIVHALDYAKTKSNLVIITGGLGPTKDDITKDVLTNYFKTTLILNEEILLALELYFKQTNRVMPEAIKSLAYLPENCTILKNIKGLAQGMLWEKDNIQYLSLPGVPNEMKYLFSEVFVPLHFPASNEKNYHATIQTAGIGESALAEKIHDIEEKLSNEISLAYLPDYGTVRLRLSGKGDDTIKQKVENYSLEIKNRIGDFFFANGDVNIVQTISKLLIEKNMMLGLAESCTGGRVANRITTEPGCSRYFKGSLVCYHNDIKKNILNVTESIFYTEGVVSEICVKEMLIGVLDVLSCDVGIAISGIAGPDGATDIKPVGLIYVAVGNKNVQVVKELRLAKDRKQNIEWTCNLALNELRLFLERM